MKISSIYIFIIFIISIFILWLFFGGQNCDYIGFKSNEDQYENMGDVTLNLIGRKRKYKKNKKKKKYSNSTTENTNSYINRIEDITTDIDSNKQTNDIHNIYSTSLKSNNAVIYNNNMDNIEPCNLKKKLKTYNNKNINTQNIEINSNLNNHLDRIKTLDMAINANSVGQYSNFRYNNITKRNLDPKKKTSKGEEICRQILERAFPGFKFNSIRPDFLINPKTGYSLELDGYNEELNIAFEYNGVQHYIFPNFFHKKNKDVFIKQLKNDRWKYDICDQIGINLIIIPYIISHNMLEQYIHYYLPQNIKNRELTGEEENPPGLNGPMIISIPD